VLNKKIKPRKKATMLSLTRWLFAVLGVLGGVGVGVYVRYIYDFHAPRDPRPQPVPIREQLYPGVTYERRVTQTPRPVVFHIVTIDLSTPGLRFLTTPGKAQNAKLPFPAQTTSQFLTKYKCQLAINGDFFYPCKINNPNNYYPHVGDFVKSEGYSVSEGTLYAQRDPHGWTTTLHISKGNQVSIGDALPSTPYNAIGGHKLHLDDLTKNGDKQTNPRTIVAHNIKTKHLYFMSIDGRQRGYSEGLTDREVAHFAKELGANEAIMLDGGGSATLVKEDKALPDGFRVLNSPIDCHIVGRERAVANHLGIFIKNSPPKESD
jgi:hypothetical protein